LYDALTPGIVVEPARSRTGTGAAESATVLLAFILFIVFMDLIGATHRPKQPLATAFRGLAS
jgi:hypothetical protein